MRVDLRPTDRLQSSHPPVGLSNTVLIENWVAETVTLQNSSTLSLKPSASSAKTEFKTDVVKTKTIVLITGQTTIY